MAEQAVLDVFELERFFEQRVVAQIDHAGGEVVAGAPVGMDAFDFFGRQGRDLMTTHDVYPLCDWEGKSACGDRSIVIPQGCNNTLARKHLLLRLSA